MKPCMVTLPLPILKSKQLYCMAEKPSHVKRVSLSHRIEIGLMSPIYPQLLHTIILW
jgi:hypothetical protein